jgi:hypothetical protein
MSSFVLIETLASERQRRPLYFARMTGIGPMTTSELAEAAFYETEEEARRSPACSFSLTFFEPVRIGDSE